MAQEDNIAIKTRARMARPITGTEIIGNFDMTVMVSLRGEGGGPVTLAGVFLVKELAEDYNGGKDQNIEQSPM